MRHTPTPTMYLLATALALAPACGDAGGDTSDSSSSSESEATNAAGTDPATSAGTSQATSQGTSAGTDSGTTTSSTSNGPSPTSAATDDPSSSSSPGTNTDTEGTSAATDGDTETTDAITVTDTEGGCGVCDQPNQMCVDDVCVTGCQGQVPDPCEPDQVCDVISGECKDIEATCVVTGDYSECGDTQCGPGTYCDGQGACIPIAPCGGVSCNDDQLCWGSACSCTREHECQDVPDVDALNGPFATDIFDLEFADDCTGWMVTLRSGTDYVRRLETDGTLTTWAGVANLNMGEIKVLKALVPASAPDGQPDQLTNPQQSEVEGIGEVAITYTCCPTCGCFVDPPQGVARLDEENMQNPLPIIIPAMPTQGSGPFGNTPADAGPMGLTWGEDRVLYVG